MNDAIDHIELLVAERAIRRLLTLYSRAADRNDLALLRSVMHDDAHLDLGHFTGTPDEFVAWAANAPAVPASQHHITNMLIEIDGDVADAEAYCVAIHGGLPGGDGATDAIVFVRYLNRLERRAGEWRIASLIAVWDWNQNVPSTDLWSGPLHGGYTVRPLPGREDRSYSELPLIARL